VKHISINTQIGGKIITTVGTPPIDRSPIAARFKATIEDVAWGSSVNNDHGRLSHVAKTAGDQQGREYECGAYKAKGCMKHGWVLLGKRLLNLLQMNLSERNRRWF
jgi:hypothetical protein